MPTTSAPARGRELRDRARAAREVEEPLPRLGPQPVDHLGVDVRDRLRDPLVGTGAPDGRMSLFQLLERHRRLLRRSTHEHTFLAMSDLFSDAAKERLPQVAPLALRLRPQRLEDFVGQEQILGERSALRLAIEQDRVGSMILYGPPGTGKTTLARIVANQTGAALRGALGGLGDRLPGAGGDRPGTGASSARRGSARSSSSTRSTASTRRSRTRCCRPSRRAS